MAVLTVPTDAELREVTRVYALGAIEQVEPVLAGSVNSNFILHTRGRGPVFFRIYEEQGYEGARYERRLLEYLAAEGLPVPHFVQSLEPDTPVFASGKPTAVFELVGGVELCQRLVRPAHLESIGRLLAQTHVCCGTFAPKRASRFQVEQLHERLRIARAAARPELEAPLGRLASELAAARSPEASVLPRSVIHGDLFRDNVRWGPDGSVICLLDWESASDGTCIYDLVVTLLAWCYGDALDWELARALYRGYASVRPLSAAEREALHATACFAAVRFSITRITDFYLRAPEAPAKDFRRYLARLDALQALSSEDFLAQLEGSS